MQFVLFLFILVGLIIRNFHLSQVLFYDWDEGMYAQIAHEVIKNKSLFTTFNDHIWLDKPPFSHALIAINFLIFGQTEFWSRLIFVFVGFILLILTYLLARKIALSLKTKPFEATIASMLSVLTLAGSPIFLERTTLLNTDTLVAVSWMGYFVFWNNYWAKLFFLTLGVWSKSILGFYPLAIEIFYWIVITRGDVTELLKKIRQNMSHLALLLFLPSAWYIAGTIKYGQVFFTEHFASQVFKRLTVPIELHFGGKFYYLEYLWDRIHVFNIIILVAYIFFTINSLKNVKKNNWTVMLPLLTPIPFLALLTVMKTKIFWYVIIFFPFLALSLTYLYITVKNSVFRALLTLSVIIFFSMNFLPETYFLKINYQPPEKIKLALCISKLPVNTISMLVEEQERKNRNFLEAAHYNTTSSFYYGGSPSFVYYSQKKVTFFYDSEDVIANDTNAVTVVSKKDLKNDVKLLLISMTRNKSCETENWLALVK